LSGARVSEVLALVPAAFDFDAGAVNITTLKRRKPGVIRQVPLPKNLLRRLEQHFRIQRAQRDPARSIERLWKLSRTTAWRRVKEVMAVAGIAGMAAMPKGLRHGFGVHATLSQVPQHLLQRWLGHASPNTTAIYADVLGREERQLAARMWHRNEF
jgi:integrase